MASSSMFYERAPVVLDVGRNYWKAGFAGESDPRHFIETTKEMRALWDAPGAEEREWLGLLPRFCAHVLLRRLACRPKERRAVVVEPLVATTAFREALGAVLFNQMQVKGLAVLSGPWPALAASAGLRGGLVVDVGAGGARILPAAEGRLLHHAYQEVPLGAAAVQRRLGELVAAAAAVEGGPPPPPPLTPGELEDAVARCCFVGRRGGHRQRDVSAVQFPLSTGGRYIQISGDARIGAADVLFTGTEEADSIVLAIFESLKKCCPELRKGLLSNIVVTGGVAMMEGFCGRLAEEIRCFFDEDGIVPVHEQKRFADIKPAISSLCITQVFLQRHSLTWAGASILASLQELVDVTMTPQEYIKNQEQLPDWLSISPIDWLFHSPYEALAAARAAAAVDDSAGSSSSRSSSRSSPRGPAAAAATGGRRPAAAAGPSPPPPPLAAAAVGPPPS